MHLLYWIFVLMYELLMLVWHLTKPGPGSVAVNFQFHLNDMFTTAADVVQVQATVGVFFVNARKRGLEEEEDASSTATATTRTRRSPGDRRLSLMSSNQMAFMHAPPPSPLSSSSSSPFHSEFLGGGHDHLTSDYEDDVSAVALVLGGLTTGLFIAVAGRFATKVFQRLCAATTWTSTTTSLSSSSWRTVNNDIKTL